MHKTHWYHSAAPAMAPKKGGKGGRPPKHATAEEAQATKQVQDQQRPQQQRHARANNLTDHEEELQAGIAEAPAAPIGALLGAPPSAAGPTAPKEPISAPPSSLQEPVLDGYPTHEPNNSP
jgi:hypothetical protein